MFPFLSFSGHDKYVLPILDPNNLEFLQATQYWYTWLVLFPDPTRGGEGVPRASIKFMIHYMHSCELSTN